jgi:hypothetical protein
MRKGSAQIPSGPAIIHIASEGGYMTATLITKLPLSLNFLLQCGRVHITSNEEIYVGCAGYAHI